MPDIKENLRTMLIDNITKTFKDTHLKIEVKDGFLTIDIVDSEDKELFLMDKARLPHIRKAFQFRYKSPIVMNVDISTN
ncbi:MAG: hypothetical protein KAU20_02440 [Nanoarchaeota archaeon]|nr:hypothetical protein [Nanoarchaeota archaeon]